jgi:hypothetical protein
MNRHALITVPRFSPGPSFRRSFAAAVFLLALFNSVAQATTEDAEQENVQAKFQGTWIWQRHPNFGQRVPASVDPGKYSGGLPQYSLPTGHDVAYTSTFTGYFGFRPWPNGEVYFDPEITQGVPFSGNLIGLAGFYNGEITRASGPNPTLYRQRLFLRQTWNQGGGEVKIESDLNWMARTVDKNRFVLTAGNFSTLDVFDHNQYAGDPRRQFMNWGNMSYAAFDYAADARGWGWGAIGEWYKNDWVIRLGRMTGPTLPNQLPTDLRILKHFGDQFEIEHDHDIGGQPGAVKVMLWRDKGRLATFRDAIDYGNARRWQPDPNGNGMEYILDVRTGERFKVGAGVNLEQAITPELGLFGRAMWSDGKTETFAFTEVDRSLSVGVSSSGSRWGRAPDRVGVSFLSNYLSRDRREYLQKGGISYFIGDGWLNYHPEQIVELYYSWALSQHLWITADFQRIKNPAYNADRGPLNIGGVRLHAEF